MLGDGAGLETVGSSGEAAGAGFGLGPGASVGVGAVAVGGAGAGAVTGVAATGCVATVVAVVDLLLPIVVTALLQFVPL